MSGAITGLVSTGADISRAGAGAEAAPAVGPATGFLNATGGAGCTASNREAGSALRVDESASVKTLVFTSGTGTAVGRTSTSAEAAIAGRADSNSAWA